VEVRAQSTETTVLPWASAPPYGPSRRVYSGVAATGRFRSAPVTWPIFAVILTGNMGQGPLSGQHRTTASDFRPAPDSAYSLLPAQRRRSLGHREPALIERLPGHRAGEIHEAEGR
jgi:hypothetical protein